MGDYAGPGWFDDPLDTSNGQQRFWNGAEWTRHVVPSTSTLSERVALTGRPFRAQGTDQMQSALLEELRRTLDEIVESGGAVDGREYEEASFDGSIERGALVIKTTRQLMLRSYNVEADQIVDNLIADRLHHALHALATARLHLNELGAPVGLRIAEEYHHLRCREMELVANHRGWSA